MWRQIKFQPQTDPDEKRSNRTIYNKNKFI